VRETRVHPETRHCGAVLRYVAIVGERVELEQEVMGLSIRSCRGRIEPRQLCRVVDPGGREIESEGQKVALEDLGRSEGEQAALIGFGPEPVAGAGSSSSGASAPLISGGPRSPLRLEARHSGAGRETRPARQSGVDDDAHPLDGEACFGDRRREHDLSASVRRRRNGAILVFGQQGSMQRNDIDAGGQAGIA
jgi:hypothetical protein